MTSLQMTTKSRSDQLVVLKSDPLQRFADWSNKDRPRAADGVCSIWNANDDFIYVGMAGRGKTAEEIREIRELMI